MLSDILERVAGSMDCSATRKRDMLSGLRRLAKALGRMPEDIPAHPVWLQKRIDKIAPAALGILAKSWANALSDARAGLVVCGIVAGRNFRGDALDARWRPLWDAALTSKDKSLAPLSRFVYFLNRLDIAPEAVDDGHASAYLDALRLNEIGRDPEVAYRAAVNMWNLAGARLSMWPNQRLTLPSRSTKLSLNLDEFPRAFRANIAQFEQSLRSPDPFDPFDAAVLADLMKDK